MEDTEYYFYHKDCGKHKYMLSGSADDVPPFSLFENIGRVLRDIVITGRTDVVATSHEWVSNCNRSGCFPFHKPFEEKLREAGADKDPSIVLQASRMWICVFVDQYLSLKKKSGQGQLYMEKGEECIKKMSSSNSYEDMISHITPMIEYLKELEDKKVNGTT